MRACLALKRLLHSAPWTSRKLLHQARPHQPRILQLWTNPRLPTRTPRPPRRLPNNSVGAFTLPASTASESDWHFTVAPYLWFPGVHGSIGGPNSEQVGFKASPGDLLSHFRFGLMGVVEPRYKRILMPLDIMWIRLGSDKALPNSPSQGVANLRATQFILDSEARLPADLMLKKLRLTPSPDSATGTMARASRSPPTR